MTPQVSTSSTYPHYLHTACVKVFQVRQLTVCHEYELILYIFRPLNPLLTLHKSLPTPRGCVSGCVVAVVFNFGSTTNQLIWIIKNKGIAVAGQRSQLNNQLLPFDCQLVKLLLSHQQCGQQQCILFQRFEVTERSVGHLDDVGLGLLQLFFVVVVWTQIE